MSAPLSAAYRMPLSSAEEDPWPLSLITRTTLQDLESRAGIGVTGGGTKIPITDVIRMAGHANHYLAVFDKATGSALDLFRARRVASPAQRIMLISREGGCSKPGCTVGAYGCQCHHANDAWRDGGNTNVDDMTLACGGDNRYAEEYGWQTIINARGECEWTPPPGLDRGQSRINYYHRPEALLRLPDDDEPPPEPAPLKPQPRNDTQDDPEHPDPTETPGGPEPPDNQAA